MNKLVPSVFILLLLTTTPAFGQTLISVNQDNTMFQTATHIPEPFERFYYTLESFEREGQSHWYSFVGIKGEEISIQIQAPDIPVSRDLTACFDLLIGQEKVTPELNKRQFHEEFTNTDWIVTCELKIILPDDGLYYIRAHDDLHHYEFGDTGKFSMFVGEFQEFTFFDLIKLPFELLHLHLFFENNVFVTVMLTFLVIVTVIILVMIKNRRNK